MAHKRLSRRQHACLRNLVISILSDHSFAVTELISLLERSEGLRAPETRLGSNSEVGTAVHQSLQTRLLSSRRKQNLSFASEVPITCTMSHRSKNFQLSGRMDLVLEGPSESTIYEIKSCDSIARVSAGIKNNPWHPAAFQAAVYAAMYRLSRVTECRCAVVLVSAQNLNIRILPVAYDHQETLKKLAALLDIALGELHTKCLAQRRKLRFARRATFPFSTLRGGQGDLVTSVTNAMTDERPILLTAPTGSGKTISALFPALIHAVKEQRTVVFATARNSQKESFAKAINDVNGNNRGRVLGITCASRDALCLNEGDMRVCDPKICSYAAAHHTRLRQSRLVKKIVRSGGVYTVAALRKIGEFIGACPFEMSLEIAQHADALACDYNQVFSERARLETLCSSPEALAQVQLIVDEAHNLPVRMRSLASGELAPTALREGPSPHHTKFFKRTNEGLRELVARLRTLVSSVTECAKNAQDTATHESVEIPVCDDVIAATESFRQSAFAHYTKLQRALSEQPFDDLARLRLQDIEIFCDTVNTESFGRKHPFSLTLEQGAGRDTIRILCKDAALVLKSSMASFSAPVFMSATLDPVDHFAQQLGLGSRESYRVLRHANPFPLERRRLFIVPQVSSVFRLRQLQIPKIARAIGKILEIQRVNTFVFAPSFGFATELLRLCPVPRDFDTHLQTPRMCQEALESLLCGFRLSDRPQVLFGVMRGSLAEGIDLPGRALQSVIIVGPALPPVSLEQSLLEDYEVGQGRNGFDQAAVIPAMIHVNQALGRLIRTPTDVGTCFLLDRRFTEPAYFGRLASEWREQTPGAHISVSLARDISHFWKSVSGVS